MKIAIVGAGISGPTLAYWLSHYGHEPTLIERRHDCAPEATSWTSGAEDMPSPNGWDSPPNCMPQGTRYAKCDWWTRMREESADFRLNRSGKISTADSLRFRVVIWRP